MSGFWWVSSSKNCSSVGLYMAGACTSRGGGPQRQSRGWSKPDGRWSRAVAGHTFADSLHGADLRPVLHGVNAEVDLGDRLLLLDRTDGIVNLLVLSPALPLGAHRVVLGVHGGVGLGGKVCGKRKTETESLAGRQEVDLLVGRLVGWGVWCERKAVRCVPQRARLVDRGSGRQRLNPDGLCRQNPRSC